MVTLSHESAPRLQCEDVPDVQTLRRPQLEQAPWTNAPASPEQHQKTTSSEERPPCNVSKLIHKDQTDCRQQPSSSDDVNTKTQELDESDRIQSLSTSTKKRKTGSHDALWGADAMNVSPRTLHATLKMKRLLKPGEGATRAHIKAHKDSREDRRGRPVGWSNRRGNERPARPGCYRSSNGRGWKH